MILRRSVLVVGGGASGALLSCALVGDGDVEVTVIEPRERLGSGVAYSTTCPLHVLNVPAAKMSASADAPAAFVEWLAANGHASDDGRAFVPRALFGEYLARTVSAVRAGRPDRLRHVRETAVAACVEPGGARVECASGETLRGDALVLAIGNAAPAAWPNIPADVHGSGRYFDSAWEPRALVPAQPDETVLLLGTGLTAVDAVLGLRHNGHRGPIFMVSRRGLLPHEHRLFDTPPAACPEAKNVGELLGKLRGSAREASRTFDNWRVAIDGVRPKTNALWQQFTLADQRRFVRHVLPYWNAHRHRMAPEAARRLAELSAAGSLRMLAGKTQDVTVMANTIRVAIRKRGTEERVVVEAGRLINCSGPEHDFGRLPHPLVRSLLASGSVAAHPLGIGLRVAADGALVGSDGAASGRLFAIGPVRYGTLIETTAIPEIRTQARQLADVLSRDARRDAERSSKSRTAPL